MLVTKFILNRRKNDTFSVAMAKRKHPFPSRTRKLSSFAPMVLLGKLSGRVGRRRKNLYNPESSLKPCGIPGFFLLFYPFALLQLQGALIQNIILSKKRQDCETAATIQRLILEWNRFNHTCQRVLGFQRPIKFCFHQFMPRTQFSSMLLDGVWMGCVMKTQFDFNGTFS